VTGVRPVNGLHFATLGRKRTSMPTPVACLLRFGVFELDTVSGELRRNGLKIRLPDQSFQILKLLLSRPGDVVTREELPRSSAERQSGRRDRRRPCRRAAR